MPEAIEAKELQLVRIFGDEYRFEIPEYQRPYAWTTEQTGELLDDLLHATGQVEDVSAAPPYFLGSIVIIKNGLEPQAQIVDGQQRITTLTILFCVLRELAAEDDRSSIDRYVYEPGDKFAGIQGHYRLAVRRRDRDFFQNNIQRTGKLSDSVKRAQASLPDSQQRMLQNASYCMKELASFDKRQRDTLMQFLVQRCYLVVVSTSDQNSAYRIFSVLNDRGLDLSPTDILKAEIIGALSEGIRSRYTEIWEEIEENLGRDRFRDLFAHIYMISMKSRPRGTLQQEFQEHVLKSMDREEFIDRMLVPYAEAYVTVTGASYQSTGGSGEVNRYLRYLNRLENFDWIPPAMAFCIRYENDPDLIFRFVRDLERLAYKMFIMRENVYRRIRRYRAVLLSIQQEEDLFASSSPLQLAPGEEADLLRALDGPIYTRPRVPRTLLLRLDSQLADAGVNYEHPVITVEHVLPQNPGRESQWLRDFPDEPERKEWTHRLANLVLLSRGKNVGASNYDFDYKKREYFQKGGAVTFALTSQVLTESDWTPEVLERRQRELISAFKREWRLEGATPPQSRAVSGVKDVAANSIYEQTRQLLQQGLTLDEVARQRGRSNSTIVVHLERLLQERDDIDLRPLLSPDRFEKIRAAFRQTGGALISSVKEILGDDYSYEESRVVQLYMQQQERISHSGEPAVRYRKSEDSENVYSRSLPEQGTVKDAKQLTVRESADSEYEPTAASKAHLSRRNLLKRHFGYDEFLPLQEEIVATVLEGKDALALMPTGGGKSLCYQLPAVYFEGLTLVVSPLIALMKDQVDALRANGIPAAFINSTLPYSEINRVQRRAQQGILKILYAAPERLSQPGFQRLLATLKVSLVAVDEAHCISVWGHDFRPDYRRLGELRRSLSGVPFLALTATATERVREDIAAQLHLERPERFVASFNRANLSYTVLPKQGDSFSKLKDLLQKHKGESVIIYCTSRKDTEEMAGRLRNSGFDAQPYHAGLEDGVRHRTQEEFIHDRTSIIVATIAFGMGIDKSNIRLIVHHNLPKSLESYYQETGRAGRDGLPSDCVLFYTYADVSRQEYFIEQTEDEAERRNAREKLARVIEFCELQACRRRFLLRYFGEEWPEGNCGGCDFCLTPREAFDATVIAQKILSAVIDTRERFGITHVADVLRGSRKKKVKSFRHDALSVYGSVDDYSMDEIKEIAGLLVEEGLLRRDEGEYPTLSVTRTGRGFLKNRDRLVLAMPKREKSRVSSASRTALDFNQGLFEELRIVRSRLAGERDIPPDAVFSDATLQEMAYYFPQSRESFLRISGIGDVKLEQFGEAFLSTIRSYARLHNIEERVKPAYNVEEIRRQHPQAYAKWSSEDDERLKEMYAAGTTVAELARHFGRNRGAIRSRLKKLGLSQEVAAGSTYDQTRARLEQGVSIEQIARERGLEISTIAGHLERLIDAGLEIDLGPMLPAPERFEAIRRAFEETGGSFLSPVKELLGEEYSYYEIKMVWIHLRRQGELPD